MATRNDSKHAGRRVGDGEVKTAHHDEVLVWAVKNLSSLVAEDWGFAPDEVEALAVDARSKGERAANSLSMSMSRFAKGKQKLTNWSTDAIREVEIGEVTRALLAKAASEASTSEVIQAIRALAPSPDFANAKLVGVEIMKPVRLVETKANQDWKLTPAGFVDLVASVDFPKEFEVEVANEVWGYDVDRRLDIFHSEQNLVDLAREFRPASVKLLPRFEKVSIWFTVRSGDFTLGEILQEIKVLRTLESKDHQVALIADGVRPEIRTLVESEGIVVIDRQDHL